MESVAYSEQASCIERPHSETSRGTRHESESPQLTVSHVCFGFYTVSEVRTTLWELLIIIKFEIRIH